jgi:hypothetical protein
MLVVNEECICRRRRPAGCSETKQRGRRVMREQEMKAGERAIQIAERLHFPEEHVRAAAHCT